MTRIPTEPTRSVPNHIITEDYIEDVEIGLLKTGKEADVYLIERRARDRSCFFAAKRYRAFEQRTFKNNAGYKAHRRNDGARRDNGMLRKPSGGRAIQLAIDKGTEFGRRAAYNDWIGSEWTMLTRLWNAGAPVPYPVEQHGDGFLMEYIGDAEQAAPRLAAARIDRAALQDLFEQFREGVRIMARAGIVHADLSPYNLLVWEEKLWFIDLPQAVPYLENIEATDYLHRDITNVCAWFVRKGLDIDPESVFVDALNVLFDYQMEDMFRAH